MTGDNPFAAPTIADELKRDDSAGSVWLVILCIVVGLRLLLAIGILAIGLLGGAPEIVIQIVVNLGFLTLVLVGLCKKQAWARLTLLWMSYVECAVLFFQMANTNWLAIPIVILSVLSILLAHSGPIKRLTEKHSVAETYVYGQSPSDGKFDGP